MGDEPEDFVSLHPKLYHYTDVDGLKGILGSQTLRATHYKFLNDPTEVSYLKSELKKQIRPMILKFAKKLNKQGLRAKRQMAKEGGVWATAKKETDGLIDTFYSVTFEDGGHCQLPYAEPFITSFCSHSKDSSYERKNGLLSQWRAYGRGGGFAIIFDTERLRKLMHEEAGRFVYAVHNIGAVAYEGDIESLERELFPFVKLMAEQHDKFIETGKWDDIGELFYALVKAASKYKHRAFREEREVRLVWCPMAVEHVDSLHREGRGTEMNGRDVKELKTRNRNSQKIPYIEVFDFEKHRWLPIEKIIVGPHPDQESLLSIAKKAIGNRRIDIQCSKTPYIEQ